VAQIQALVRAGCEIVRLAVLDEAAARAIADIRRESPVPLVADIHFDHRLALAALDAGVDGLRINPGNIGGEAAVDAVAAAARDRGAPIRIGVNSGSRGKGASARVRRPHARGHGGKRPDHVALLEKRGFDQIKISLKSSNVPRTIAAYRLLAEKVDYPLHIGITEAGTPMRGAVKSGVGLGLLLWEGLGDTLRVSLTGDPVTEMGAAWEILRCLGIRSRGPEIVSCPTCGRTEIDLAALAEAVEQRLAHVTEGFTVAGMGCVVNGPGEAREADIGLAGGRGLGVIFRKGELLCKVKGQEALLARFMEELERVIDEKKKESACA
jgi:(E)-4-hydroxy-3-methylbut-2-enyl-diphosphate synthase